MNRSLIFLLLIASSCTGPVDDNLPKGNKFDDPVIREIYDLQDKRNTSQLVNYFNRQEADYRREAALAMASVQDSAAIPELIKLLHDEFVDVRLAASYAIGQAKNEMAESGILNALQDESVPLVRRELWEALGKCATERGIKAAIAYNDEDSLEKEGVAWAIYRIGLRGKATEGTTKKAVELLDLGNSYQARLGAANYLARARNISISGYEIKIAESAKKDFSPFVRMASARALGRSDDSLRGEVIYEIITSEPDPRVIINSISALPGNDSDSTVIRKCLQHEDVNVVLAAAGFVLSHPDNFRTQIESMIESASNWRAKAELLGEAIKYGDTRDLFSEKAKTRFEETDNIYEKGWILSALSNAIQNHEFVWDQAQKAENKMISTSGISALASMRSLDNFDEKLNDVFLEYFRAAIASGDLAMIGIASGVLSNPKYGYKEKISDYSFLAEAKEKLSLPRDNEALQILERTIDYFEGRVSEAVVNEYNHPINWETVARISEGQLATIHTSKGDITIELLVNDSPGSVENFYTLANNHFYDGKVFHRVVPNFVIQGGDPRGDGWGSEDYSIRSELGPLRYKEGSMGMASAGKDTEGIQWFITHSPTPHLDGIYSIFAQVVEGMNVVNAIEVGDIIQSVEFENN